MADQPEPGSELIIRYREERFTRKHACLTRRLNRVGVMGMDEELHDSDAEGEVQGVKLLVVKRVAAARMDGAIRMGDVIERIIAHDNIEQPMSPPN